ncbi:MAG: hypothetical protein HY063_12860 [Bacteroidetes bacterium]|nr:hypothetical protein [Bacteroidota bacterium]
MKQTLKKAKVATDFQKLSASDLATFADGTVTGLTGNANLPAPTIALATITTQTTALRNTLKLIASGNTSKTITAQAATQANALMLSLGTNGHYVEDTANTIAAGDLKKAEGIITSSGYKLKKKATPHPRDFEVVETGPGFVHLRAKKAKKGAEGHIWRYGITTAKGTPPTTVIVRFTLGADIIISDLASNTVVGAQHASILPVAHTKKTDPSSTQTSKTATQVALSKTRHPMYSNMVADPYQWTDFIYAVIP